MNWMGWVYGMSHQAAADLGVKSRVLGEGSRLGENVD